MQNEIVAHATAAAALDPDGGRSLSIVEIGGQDAKFINVENGRVVDADMNRVCSAGTGSFLEEQAIAHGVDDIAEFGRLAALSDGPPDLGQTCTVFVADVAAEALGDGFSREDIFAGLQHSVVRNYRSRVMGQRRLLDRVFFQGKPATDPALARTLAAVLEREVVVPADPGAMGAVGIALLAASSRGRARRRRRPAIDLARVLDARVAGRREFQCGDRDCLNSCHLELAEIDIGGAVQKIVSGGQCPKYDAVSAAGDKLPKDAPNPYREREALLRSLLDEEAGNEPRVGRRGRRGRGRRTADRPALRALSDRHAAVLRHAAAAARPPGRGPAAGPRHARRGRPALRRPGRLRAGQAAARPGRRRRGRLLRADLRAPAAAQRRRADLHLPHGAGRAGHGRARAARRGLATRVLRPALFEREGDGFDAPRVRRSISLAMRALADSAGGGAPLTPALFDEAYEAALDAQRRFEAGLHAIGERALRWARGHGYPVVLIAGETHVIHDAVLDAGIHELVAANGALPLPGGLLPDAGRRARDAARALGERRPGAARHGRRRRRRRRVPAAARRLRLRAQLDDRAPVRRPRGRLAARRARERRARRQGGLRHARAGVPAQRASLARDGRRRRGRGHGAPEDADLSARPRPAGRTAAHDATGAGMQARLARLDRRLPHSLDAGYDRFYFGHVGGGLGRHLAAAMRGAGYDASYVGEPDAAALRAAGAACSGKECLPYQLIWGSFARFLDEEAARLDGKKALFLSAGNGFQACRANLFPLTEQISLERLGLSDRVEVADFSLVTGNVRMMPVVWIALVAVDLLNMLRFYSFADEAEPGASDALFAEYSGRLEAMLEQPRPDAGLAGNVAGAFRFCSEVEELLAEAAARVPGAAARRGEDRRTCATSTSAATCTCASTSGATTTCSASSPATACASSSSRTGRSSSCCSSARSRTACRSRSAPRRRRRWRPCATSSAA